MAFLAGVKITNSIWFALRHPCAVSSTLRAKKGDSVDFSGTVSSDSSQNFGRQLSIPHNFTGTYARRLRGGGLSFLSEGYGTGQARSRGRPLLEEPSPNFCNSV